jgi:hypothetical protein
VGPQQAAQRAAPSGRLAEQLSEAVLLHRVVVPLPRRDPDLGIQGHGPDGLVLQVLDAQLERQARNGRELLDLGALDAEIRSGTDGSPEGGLVFGSRA